MKIKCLVGMHKWQEMKNGTRWVAEDGAVIYDKLCTECGKLETNASDRYETKNK